MSGGKKQGKRDTRSQAMIYDLAKGEMPSRDEMNGVSGWCVKPTTAPSMQAKGALAVERVRLKSQQWSLRKSEGQPKLSNWQRETHVLPRLEAQKKTRAFFQTHPKSDYLAEIESWRVLEDERVEFTLRYLPIQS